MSPDWDARMKSSCGKNCLVIPVYDHIDEQAWQPTGRDTAFWMLDADLKCHSVRPWIPIQHRRLEEDTMAMSGGAWMIRKDYYWELDGHDERFGMHGCVGSEWSLKVWLTGGRILIRTDVICSHLFRAKAPYECDITKREKIYQELRRMWVLGEDPRRKRPIEWLLYKFGGYTKHRPLSKITIR